MQERRRLQQLKKDLVCSVQTFDLVSIVVNRLEQGLGMFGVCMILGLNVH